MRPGLQLHRSLFFWFGLLMIAFLGWAWRDSLRYDSSVGFGRHFIANSCSGVTLASDGDLAEHGFGASREELRSPRPDVWIEIFAKPFLLQSEELSEEDKRELRQKLFLRDPNFSWREFLALWCPKISALFLPHWLILAGWVLVWAALLLWRARRRRRLGKALTGTA